MREVPKVQQAGETVNTRKLFCALFLTAGLVGSVSATPSAEEMTRAVSCPDSVRCLFATSTATAAGALRGTLAEPTVLRSRVVQIDTTLLGGDLAPLELGFNLFEDMFLTVRRDRVERRATDRYSWFGLIDGNTNLPGPLRAGHAIVVYEADALVGIIQVNGKTFELRSLQGNTCTVFEIDQSKYPAEAAPVHVPKIIARDTTPEVLPSDLADTIDVMVAYTAAAAAGAGSSNAINALVQLGLDETNQAYAYTGVTQRVRLVYRGQVNYVESGVAGTDLARLALSGDGYLDDVLSLRSTYRADIVSLWTEQLNECGIGYLMDHVSTAFAPYALSIVKRSCVAGYYSFAHEMGHNMGLQHDRTNANSAGAYSFSYGYQEPTGLFRTIMAYDCPVPCPRVQGFSTPLYTVSGRPIGVAAGAADSADNARTLNQTASTVANFVNSAGTVSGPSAGFTYSPASPAVGQVVSFTDTSTGSPTSWYWAFGDGISSGLQSPTHAFPALGTFGVTLTASNTGGVQQVTKSVTVSAVAACTPAALCLVNNRFRVTASWQTATASGTGTAVQVLADSGYFWFFGSGAIEVVVKVVNGCVLNSRYWVFAGGLTNVGVTLKVTDTVTGVVRTYSNPQTTAFQPIQDTAAFATCP